MISKIKQTLHSLKMCLSYDTRQIIKRILLYDYLYGAPRYMRIHYNREISSVPPCAKPIQPPQHESYHKVQSFLFPNTKPEQKEIFLFYDIFARNNELFVLFAKEYHETLAIRSEDIHITVNQQALTHTKTFIGQNRTHVFVYAFDYPFTEHQVRVSCKGVSKDFAIQHACLKQTGLLLHSTLFKDDHFLLPMFYDYYTKQGVDSFVWYYNGVWDQTLQNKYSFGDNVIILSWPYPFLRDGPAGYTGQYTQELHTLYKYGKPSYEYIGFLNMDEYVKTEHANLRSYILQNSGYLSYVFLNCWTWVFRLPGRYRPKTRKRLPKVLLRSKNTVRDSSLVSVNNANNQVRKYQNIARSKGIYKTSVTRIIMHSYLLSNLGTAQHKLSLVKPSSILLHIVNLRKRESETDATFTHLYRGEPGFFHKPRW